MFLRARLAPLVMSRIAASLEPASAAWCNDVKPVRFAEFIFAPALSKALIMAVSFLIAAQLSGRRPFGFPRISSPFTSAPALIETMAAVTLPAMTASHKAICCCRRSGTAGGCNADELGGVLTPADPIAAGRD